MIDVYLGLGSNLGDREHMITEAIKRLSIFCEIVELSVIYETMPFGVLDQPMFLNAAVHVRTAASPGELLNMCKQIEREMGRVKTMHHGPREIDIDVLLYGDLVLRTAELVIPHVAMHERLSVLDPLMDIAKDVIHPVFRVSVAQLHTQLQKKT